MTLVDKAYESIHRQLVNAEYLPGDILSENELAVKLSMSRTPIRAAISRLENEGFVTIVKNRGIFVNDISFKEVCDTFATINSFILYTCDLVEKGIVQLNFEQLFVYIEEMKLASMKEDYVSYNESFNNFIAVLIASSQNCVMAKLISELTENLRRAGMINFKLNGDHALYTSYDFSLNIYNCLKEGQFHEMKEILNNHIDEAKRKYIMHQMKVL